METDDRLRLLARLHQRIPVAAVERWEPELLGRLAERDGLVATGGVLADLLGRDLRVEQPGELTRDDAIGIGLSPLLEQPVVPRPHDGQAELGIVAQLQSLSGE